MLEKLLRQHSITDIYSTRIDTPRDFLALTSQFANEVGTVALCSGGTHECSTHHILAIDPWLAYQQKNDSAEITLKGETLCIQENPFDVLRTLLNSYQLPQHNLPAPITSGLFGYLAYDLKHALESLPRTTYNDQDLPDICLYAPRYILVQPTDKPSLQIFTPIFCDENTEQVRERTQQLIDSLSFSEVKSEESFTTGELTSSYSRDEYLEAIREAKQYILEGDIYQANISQRFHASFHGSPFHLFCQLYKENPAPFFSFLQCGDHQILSTSPERFIHAANGKLESRPIKGTRPRGKNAEEDSQFQLALQNDPKEDAELSMIVDLIRNDLGKISQKGSVHLKEHKRSEQYTNVHHLVSIIESIQEKSLDRVDVIKALFPGGSITGCPKIRAMEIIDELEPFQRHVYTGAIGYLSFHDTMDLSIAIRTATVAHQQLSFWVGGGIVYDSDPEKEYEESIHKGQSFFHTLNTNHHKEPLIWHNGKYIPRPTATVPLTALGVQHGIGLFETMKYEDGTVRHLDRHIKRFQSSWLTLGLPGSPPQLDWKLIIGRLLERNKTIAITQSIKLLALGEESLSIIPKRLSNNGSTSISLSIYPEPRDHFLANHKTTNYLFYSLASKWAEQHNAMQAVILNTDGSISETHCANILIVKNQAIIKPLSKHVLPGVTEEVFIAKCRELHIPVHEEKLSREDLFKADGILVTNALIGVVEVRQLEGKSIPMGSEFITLMKSEIDFSLR